MSIARSTKLVTLTLNGVTESIPIDHKYTRVCQINLVPSKNDISAIFEANKEYYYRKVFETLGNGSDYKHYTQEDGSPDPRCNCILCWTYRKSWKPTDYPTVRAKLLCMADQMQREYVHKNMSFDSFKKLTASYRFGSFDTSMKLTAYARAGHDLNVHLWEMLFPGVPLNTSKESIVDIVGDAVDKSLEVEYIQWTSKTGRVHLTRPLPSWRTRTNALTALLEHPNPLEERILRLQKRANSEYELSELSDEIRSMTTEQVELRHQGKLIDSRWTDSYWSAGFDNVGLLIKHMFLHKYILETLYANSGGKPPKRILSNNSYFSDIRGIRNKKEKYKIFLSRISRANALIKAALRGFYFHDPELTFLLKKRYYEFNAEFKVFLTPDESENFAKIFDLKSTRDMESTVLSNKFKKHVQKCKTDYMVQKVEIKLEEYKDKTDDYLNKIGEGLRRIYELREALKIIRLEKSILMGRVSFGIYTDPRRRGITYPTGPSRLPRINYRKRVRSYIEKLNAKIRSAESIPGFDAKIKELTIRNRDKFVDNFITENMQYLYNDLPGDLKEKVDKRCVRDKFKLVTGFMNVYGIQTHVPEVLASQAYGRPIDDAFSEEGGFRDIFFTKKYIEEFFQMSAYARTELHKVERDINVLKNKLERLIELDELAKSPRKTMQYMALTRWRAGVQKDKRSRNAMMQGLRKKNEQLKKMKANPNRNEKEIRFKRWKLYTLNGKKAKLERMSYHDKRWQLYWWYYGERNRAKKLWKLSMELLDDKQKAEEMQDQLQRRAGEVIREFPKQTTYINDKKYEFNKFAIQAIAEVTLECDIFGVNHFKQSKSELMDKFILGNLPPKERLAFKMIRDEFSDLESALSPGEELERARTRFQELREPFRAVVFEKELIKRSVLRYLNHKWSEVSTFQRWVPYKYKHKRLWLANNQKVLVFINFNDLFKEFKNNKRKRPDEAELAGIDERTKELIRASTLVVKKESNDTNWYGDRELSTTRMGWIQHIDQNFVRVELVRPITVKNASMRVTRVISEIRVDISDVYENGIDYEAMVRYKKAHMERIQQEKNDRDKLIELRRARRQFVFGSMHTDLAEQQKLEKARELEDKTALMVFSPEKKLERYTLFMEWTSMVIEKIGREGNRNCSLPESITQAEPFRYQMFEDGREQWLGQNESIGDAEEPISHAAQRIQRYFIDQPERNNSNKWTRVWRMFIEWYGMNSLRPVRGGGRSRLGDMPTLVRMYLFDETRGKGPAARGEYLETFKTQWEAARIRAVNRARIAFRKATRDGTVGPSQVDGLGIRKEQLCDVVLGIVNDIIKNLNAPDQDSRLLGQPPEIVRYILTELEAEVESVLKSPLQKYTSAMWKNEIERSVSQLGVPYYTELNKFVKDEKEYEYAKGNIVETLQITDYYKTFLFRGKKKFAFPVPSNEELEHRLNHFDANMRIALGPGSWFELDETSDMMRVTGLNMEERLLFAEEIKEASKDYSVTRHEDIDTKHARIKQQELALSERKRELQVKIDKLKQLLSTKLSIAARVDFEHSLDSFISALKIEYIADKTEMERIKDIRNQDISWKKRKLMIESNINKHFNRKEILIAKRELESFKQSLEGMGEGADIDSLVRQLEAKNSRLISLSEGSGGKKWKQSDGDGTLHIIDDCVGDFTYENDSFIRNPSKDDFPTHLRLNCVYCDTRRGIVDGESVRRLEPFYIVSLYKKTKDGCERLRVRNRADPTFFPRQDKFSTIKTQLSNRRDIKKMQLDVDKLTRKSTAGLSEEQIAQRINQIDLIKTRIREHKEKIRMIETSDYRGYTFSLCLSESEFLSLTNKQMDAGAVRVLNQLPKPLLHHYHTLIYNKKKEKMEQKLIERKRLNDTSALSFDEEEMKIADDDDPSMPLIDDLIRLKNSAEDVFHNGFSVLINGTPIPKKGLYYEDGSMFYAVEDAVVDLKIKNIVNVAIYSDTLFAYIARTERGLELYHCEYNSERRKFESEYIYKFPRGTLLAKWSGDILLVIIDNVVWGFNKNEAYAQTLLLEGHTKPITSVATHRGMIATASEDNTVMLWNNQMPLLVKGAIEKGTKVLANVRRSRRFGIVKKVTDEGAYKVHVNVPNNKRGEVGIFPCEPSAHITTIRGHTNQVRSVEWCVSNRKSYLISSSSDKTVCIWQTNGKTAKLMFRLDFHMLGIPQHMNSTRGQSEITFVNSQRHLGSDKNVDIAVVGNVVIYYYDNIVGKLNPETGRIIKFTHTVLNAVKTLDTIERDKPSVIVDDQPDDSVESSDEGSEGTDDSDDTIIEDGIEISLEAQDRRYKRKRKRKKQKTREREERWRKDREKKWKIEQEKWKQKKLENQARSWGMTLEQYRNSPQAEEDKAMDNLTAPQLVEAWQSFFEVEEANAAEEADESEGRGGGESKK